MGLITKALSLRGVMRGLHEDEAGMDPIALFDRWYRFAKRAGVFLPNAVCLATVSPDGKPSARMMLLKGASEKGFVFYTNYDSRKGGEIANNANVALCFHWTELQRQVRVEGSVVRASAEQSDAYFRSRIRGSRIGAWSSAQSREIPTRETLHQQYMAYAGKFGDGDIPRPPFWGGFVLKPVSIEFWQGRAFRLHDRLVYRPSAAGWTRIRLSP